MSRGRWKRAVLGLAMLGGSVVITLGTGLGMLFWTRSETPGDSSQKLAAAGPWLFAWRCLLFGALIGFWPTFCRSVARWRELTNDQLGRIRQPRWTVATWLVALELLLGQNVAGRFINLWVSRS
ncbi:MAG: hypothetical protein M3495_14560 [Pseudomonadota bacterium]|nr:hypothetical protein [Gammaproteobacteria bacterium]MDQ3582744.1 hypothetical protein [Pseudomonadota bacterium]